MKLFDDTVLLELVQDEWDAEDSKSRIITPQTVKEKRDGTHQEKIPWHFFKVIAVGSDCKKVEVGDRVFPKTPNLHCQPQLIPIFLWINDEKVMKFEIRESDVGGVE